VTECSLFLLCDSPFVSFLQQYLSYLSWFSFFYISFFHISIYNNLVTTAPEIIQIHVLCHYICCLTCMSCVLLLSLFPTNKPPDTHVIPNVCSLPCVTLMSGSTCTSMLHCPVNTVLMYINMRCLVNIVTMYINVALSS